MWRRAKGPRRRLLHGIIQVAVGYEHDRRGNARGRASLLRQGAAKLRYFTRRPGVRELRERALADADATVRVVPPKVMLTLDGAKAPAPKGSLRIELPRA